MNTFTGDQANIILHITVIEKGVRIMRPDTISNHVTNVGRGRGKVGERSTLFSRLLCLLTTGSQRTFLKAEKKKTPNLWERYYGLKLDRRGEKGKKRNVLIFLIVYRKVIVR